MAGRPHYYLHFLATFKSWSGKGSASAVLQPILDVADKTGIECYLEAAGEKLIPFYEKFGFVKKGRIDVNGDNTIVLVPMVRLPKERK
ncbi:hypothetical protein M427DRAFT_53526 [Gonapodya prolifera JEL478]|uniref:N-acetyltransferase domain-containing protein n=1 Tax=Gonapodya prolifera (strain JEL478) TaxID=1344416 RepID=A0A139APC0_GONPJ|nr:hypothetical protein M427DRAFT_53526 [Gonapodya prolifera JEL478]|eukprot:KXS18572.1 hypothetical protein M427DRAFT_53526 [Gonapodya prolifera JEL478]